MDILSFAVAAAALSGGGGGSAPNLYINSVKLSGNKTSADLHITNTIDATISANNVLTLKLKSGTEEIATATVTIPTASVVESVYFDHTTNEMVITFTNGQTLRMSLTNVISALLPLCVGFTINTADWTASGSNYTADLTSQANNILSQMYEYNAVTPVGTENPSEEGWYEKNSNNEYVLTEDTTVQSGKTYFERTSKTLNGTYQFNLTADTTAQGILDAGTATQIACITTKVSGVWKLYAVAMNGTPSSQITIPCTMAVVGASSTDMTIVGSAIYKSVNGLDATNFSSDALSSLVIANGKILDVQLSNDNSLGIVDGGLGHNNIVTAQTTQTLSKVAFDGNGHITGATEASSFEMNITYTDGTTETKNVVVK